MLRAIRSLSIFGSNKPTPSHEATASAGQELQTNTAISTFDLDNISRANVFPGLSTKAGDKWYHIVFKDEQTATRCATLIVQRLSLQGLPTVQPSVKNYNADLGKDKGSFFFRIPEAKFAAFNETYIDRADAPSLSM